MGWYDAFARFYDHSLEALYAEQRARAADALRLGPGLVVLDVPCGTGQSLDVLASRVEPNGAVVGVDLSIGMLARARARAVRRGLARVELVRCDVHALAAATIAGAVGRVGDATPVDRVHVFLGLSTFPRWPEAFERLWSLLRPGGRAVLVDVHADPIGLRGRAVNLVARADIRRRFWAPLERVARGYERTALPSRPAHGGTLFLAAGDKPA